MRCQRIIIMCVEYSVLEIWRWSVSSCIKYIYFFLFLPFSETILECISSFNSILCCTCLLYFFPFLHYLSLPIHNCPQESFPLCQYLLMCMMQLCLNTPLSFPVFCLSQSFHKQDCLMCPRYFPSASFPHWLKLSFLVASLFTVYVPFHALAFMFFLGLPSCNL